MNVPSPSRLRVRAPLSPLQTNEVFAVDATSAQLCLRPATERAVLRIAGRRIELDTTLGVAVIEVRDLHPNTNYVATIESDTGEVTAQISFRTRQPLTGDITKFATISDVHLGTTEFGGQRSIKESESTNPPFAVRCARAAIAEAIDWGAEALLIKGDLTDTGAEGDWDLAHELLDNISIPVIATWGNHDVWKTRDLDPQVAQREFALSSGPITTSDLAGIRLLMADTSIPDRGHGDIAQYKEQILDLSNVDGPVFLGIHHNIMRTSIPWFWPPGIFPRNAAPLLAELPRANPNIFVSSGHTHRNRRHSLGPGGSITFTEVAATADYPGVWAGYEVSSDTVRQTVRRIAAPDALSWSERVRGALGGVWPRWSQGTLDDRCVDMAIT